MSIKFSGLYQILEHVVHQRTTSHVESNFCERVCEFFSRLYPAAPKTGSYYLTEATHFDNTMAIGKSVVRGGRSTALEVYLGIGCIFCDDYFV